MIKEKRLKKIQEYVLKNESASLDELVDVFQVSKNTIRRDVQELVESGEFKKVYGGIAVMKKELESFQDRKVQNLTGKQKIGELAASFIEDGDIIFIDSGTTTVEIFEHIKEKRLTVLTNNLEFIFHATNYQNINIISTGGILERETNSFSNYNNLDIIKLYNINKAFMASTGISISNGVTNSSPYETLLKRTIVEKSNQVFLLVDHKKFDKYGLMTYCQLKYLHYVITDELPPKTYQEYFNEHNTPIVCPSRADKKF